MSAAQDTEDKPKRKPRFFDYFLGGHRASIPFARLRLNDNEKVGYDGAGDSSGSSPYSNQPEEEKPVQDTEWWRQENIERRRVVQTLPPWIHSYRYGEDHTEELEPSRLLPRSPPNAVAAHHHYAPSRGFGGHHSLEAEIAPRPPGNASRWQSFVRTSAYSTSNPPGNVVSSEWIKQSTPNFDEPWERGFMSHEKARDKRFWLFSPEKRAQLLPRIHIILMKNPFVPLVIRLTVLTFSTAALALGSTIYHGTNRLNQIPNARARMNPNPTDDEFICNQQPSTYMAFIVGACAVVYLCYITWDEYTSKPLGLRSSKAKMRLLFLDLLFIVFSAANLSLAFATVTDEQWACYPQSGPINSNAQAARSICVMNEPLCARQKALCGVLTIAEIAWLMTFATSTLRIVHHLTL